MAYGSDIVMGLMPRSNNPFGSNRTMNWQDIMPAYSPDAETVQPVQPQGFGMMTLPPPPIPGMPRQQMAFSPATPTPVVAAATPEPAQPAMTMPAVGQQPQPTQEVEDIGDWDPTKPFELPDVRWKVMSFTPNQAAQIEMPGVKGMMTVKTDSPAYQAIQKRYNNLTSLYEQSRVRQAQEQGQPTEAPTKYPIGVNVGGQKRFGRWDENDRAFYLDMGEYGEVAYDDWTNIPEKDFSFQLDPVTKKPMNQDYMKMRENLGYTLRERAKELNQFANGEYKSAPTQGMMYEGLKVKITGGEGDATPNFEFYWDGPGEAPAGLIDRAKKNLSNMLSQTDYFANQYDQIINARAQGNVENYVANLDKDLANYQAQLQQANSGLAQAESSGDKKAKSAAREKVDDLQLKVNSLQRIRDKALSTRSFGLDGGLVIEEMPALFGSSVDPKTWQGKLALASGLGYTNPNQATPDAQPVLDSEGFAKIAIADAVTQTDITPMGVDQQQFNRALRPTISRINAINDMGKEEFGGSWDKIVANEPTLFQFTDAYGTQQTISKPLPDAINEVNAALRATMDAVAIGDQEAYATASQKLRDAGALFSGSITPPRGLETTLPTKSERYMANLPGAISEVRADNALIPGRLTFGSMNRNLMPPKMMYQPPMRESRGRDKEKKYVSAQPFISFGIKGGAKLVGDPISVKLTEPDVWAFTKADFDPGRARTSAQRLLASSTLKPLSQYGEQDKKFITETVNNLNSLAANKEKGRSLRQLASDIVYQQFQDLGFTIGSRDSFVNDLESVFGGQIPVQKFIETYWGYGPAPSSNIARQAYDGYLGSATRKMVNDKIQAGNTQYRSAADPAVDVVTEGVGTKIRDLAYYFGNLGKGDPSHMIGSNDSAQRGGVKFTLFIDPFSQENQQSPLTAISSVNTPAAVPFIDSAENAALLASGNKPNVEGVYDISGSLQLFNLRKYGSRYNTSILDIFGANPDISNKINRFAESNVNAVGGNLRGAEALRGEEDESSRYDNDSTRNIPRTFMEALFITSMFPENRIFAAPKR